MQAENRFDLTGQKFGKLTALQSAEGKNSKAKWRCRCECGSEKLVSYHNLTQNLTTSCGCARGRKRELSGQRFGRLTALEPTGEKRGSSYIWKCRCDCGKETNVPADLLLSGKTKSCGCLVEETKRAAFRDIAGQRFGRLTAVEPEAERSAGSVVWKCVCDCGASCRHPVTSLLSGAAKSCGCLRKENDSLQRTLHYIDGTCVEFIENTATPSARNTSGHRGVKWVRGKWQAYITFKKKTWYLGRFDDINEAVRIRKRAEDAVYGEFLEWYYLEFPERAKEKKQK